MTSKCIRAVYDEGRAEGRGHGAAAGPAKAAETGRVAGDCVRGAVLDHPEGHGSPQADAAAPVAAGDRPRAVRRAAPRHGLVAIPRGNGKSTLAAALGLYGLLADGVEGAQVLCVASDQRQAEIVFRAARRMVELNPRARRPVQVFQRHSTPAHRLDAVALPAEPGALQGYDPSLAVVDELHVVTDEVYEAMSAAAGKRDRP